MDQYRKLTLRTSTLAYPLLIVLVIWIVFWAEGTYGFNLNDWGIRPRTLIGLRGIIFSPFIHGSVKHALSNTLPMLFLAIALFYFYEGIAWKVLIYGALVTGFFTWLIGRGHSVHIGASGVVYLMVSFLFFKGILSKNYRLIALSLIVVFVYGSLVWGMFPGKPHISWEGHLSGFGSGLFFALIYRKYKVSLSGYEKQTKNREVSKQEKEFLRHFDEEGNFISSSEMELSDDRQDNSMGAMINYEFKPYESKIKSEDTQNP